MVIRYFRYISILSAKTEEIFLSSNIPFNKSNSSLKKRQAYSLGTLARWQCQESAHGSILFVLFVVVIACNYGIPYSSGDKTAHEGVG